MMKQYPDGDLHELKGRSLYYDRVATLLMNQDERLKLVKACRIGDKVTVNLRRTYTGEPPLPDCGWLLVLSGNYYVFFLPSLFAPLLLLP